MIALAEFVAQPAAHVAQAATGHLRNRQPGSRSACVEACGEYRTEGPPLGDIDEGFIAWLTPIYHPPTA